MKTEKAKKLDKQLEKWANLSLEIINATKYNKSEFEGVDLIKSAFYEVDFDKMYLEFIDEINENIAEYQNIDYIDTYLEGAFPFVMRYVEDDETDIKSEIIKNGYEVKFLLGVTEKTEKYIERIEKLLYSEDGSTYAPELEALFCNKMKTIDPEFSFEDAENETESAQTSYDKFNFENLKQELAAEKTNKNKLNLIYDRLIDFEQWCIQYNENNKDSIWDVVEYEKSEFTKLCNSEIKRYTTKREPNQTANQSFSTVNELYKWNSTDTDFLELFAALYQNESIVRADGKPLTRKEMLDYFQSIFGLEIKDTEGKLTKAGNRNDNTAFLDTLAQEFRNYVAGKEKKLKSRK